MTWFVRFLAAAMVLMFPPMALGMELYVAPDGDDGNPGTKAEPLATLEAARDAIREWKGARGLPEGGVTVNLRGGEYLVDQTFELGSQDSGSVDTPIVYRAFEFERVRLVGGRQIPGDAFRPIQDPAVRNRIIEQSARDRVLEVDLKKLGLTNYGRFVRFGVGVKPTKHAPSELFFDDQPMTVARWPNQGYVKIDKVIRRGSAPRFHLPDVASKGRESGPTNIPGVFRYRGTRPTHWAEAREVWLHGYWAYDWADECMRIGDIDTEKREITLSHPHWYGIKGVLGQGERYYALNLLEEIDIPGEYYLDPYGSMLYFYPPGNVNDKPIVLSLLTEPFVLMKDVSHVTLRGLVMEVSRDQGVVVEGGSHNRIAGCVIRNIADSAVRIDGGTDHRVVGCDISNVGRGGISLVGGDQRTLTPASHQAINNHIHHFSRRSKTYQFAIALKGVGHRMAHNLIHDSPHVAIDYRGNNHMVEFNEIHHVCQESDDAGAINTDRDYSIRGNVVRYNFFHHITGLRPDRDILGAHMIYLDGCKSGDDFFGNVFYKGAATVIKLGGGRDVTIKNNIFVDLGHPVRVFSIGFRSHRSCVISSYQALVSKADYTRPPWSSAFPKLAEYPNDMDELSIPRGNVIANNLFYRTKEVQVHFDKEISPSIVTIENNYQAEKDPFVDIASMNFQLKDDSIVFKKMPGFKKIPFDKIGLYGDEYRPPRR